MFFQVLPDPQRIELGLLQPQFDPTETDVHPLVGEPGVAVDLVVRIEGGEGGVRARPMDQVIAFHHAAAAVLDGQDELDVADVLVIDAVPPEPCRIADARLRQRVAVQSRDPGLGEIAYAPPMDPVGRGVQAVSVGNDTSGRTNGMTVMTKALTFPLALKIGLPS